MKTGPVKTILLIQILITTSFKIALQQSWQSWRKREEYLLRSSAPTQTSNKLSFLTWASFNHAQKGDDIPWPSRLMILLYMWKISTMIMLCLTLHSRIITPTQELTWLLLIGLLLWWRNLTLRFAQIHMTWELGNYSLDALIWRFRELPKWTGHSGTDLFKSMSLNWWYTSGTVLLLVIAKLYESHNSLPYQTELYIPQQIWSWDVE